VRPTQRFVGVALATVLWVVALAFGSGAGAQEPESVTLQLAPSRGSGVSGTAVVEDAEGGVQVTLDMRGLPEAGVKHINHIHAGGTCADDRAGRTAPVTIPLETIVAKEDGTGSATTNIEDVTLDDLLKKDKERFILLHAETKEGEGVPPGISCVDLAPLAATGGPRPSTLGLVGAILAVGAVTGFLALLKRAT
jgi:Cu/Zn superoxide dismutase